MLKCINGTSNLASQIKEAIFLRDTDYLLTETMVFIPVPDWPGWKIFEEMDDGKVDYIARWEVYFPSDRDCWLIFLRITWPAVAQILLGFISPAEDKILEQIFSHRQIMLLDFPLSEGRPNSLSKGILIHNIPTETLKMIGIGSNCLVN